MFHVLLDPLDIIVNVTIINFLLLGNQTTMCALRLDHLDIAFAAAAAAAATRLQVAIKPLPSAVPESFHQFWTIQAVLWFPCVFLWTVPLPSDSELTVRSVCCAPPLLENLLYLFASLNSFFFSI